MRLSANFIGVALFIGLLFFTTVKLVVRCTVAYKCFIIFYTIPIAISTSKATITTNAEIINP